MTCQQETRLNFKRRIYSTHTEGAPQVFSLGDRGGCATGPYRTHTTLGQLGYQDTELLQFYLIHKNKHREAAKMRRQRSIAQMKEQSNTPKRTKRNGDKQSIRCRVQNTGNKDDRGLSEDLNSI